MGGQLDGRATLVEATQNTDTFNGGDWAGAGFAGWWVGWIRATGPPCDFAGSYGKITEPGTPTEKTAIYHADSERDESFSARFFALGQVAFDHNFSQSLDLQQIYGGGLGWTIVKQAKQTLDLKARCSMSGRTL